ncbi:MAG: hypothetical protein HFH47_00410, partial [Bacilli bacterium]|nr:hypothetical protein [Bacilli bacterium]
TNLVSPGDSIEYTITISNGGNINAKLDKITLSEPDNEYITFETSGLTEGDELNTGSTADLKVTVTFKDVEINKMDTSTSNLTVQLEYSQADSSSDMPGPSGPYAAEMLAEKVVTTGDGLYIDTYESGAAPVSEDTNANTRYIYRGKNPDNYITFNNELWRIIAVEKDGTLKIWNLNGLSEPNTWDDENTKNWTRPASLNTYLNEDYYNSLDSNSRNLIQNHIWNIGGVEFRNNNMIQQIADEKSVTWLGNIGLISPSDLIKSNTDETNCGNMSVMNQNNCSGTTYLEAAGSKYYYTISPDKNNNYIIQVTHDASLYQNPPTTVDGIYPTLYLKSDITLSGSGTQADPYTIQ